MLSQQYHEETKNPIGLNNGRTLVQGVADVQATQGNWAWRVRSLQVKNQRLQQQQIMDIEIGDGVR